VHSLDFSSRSRVVNAGTLAVSKPFSFTQTWNAAGVTFTGMKFNATDTASAAASLLFDFSVGGTSVIKGSKVGAVTVGDAANLGSFVSTGGGTGNPSGGMIFATNTGFPILQSQSGQRFLSADLNTGLAAFAVGCSWVAAVGTATTGSDVFLLRDAANTLALRNSTNAQQFSLYNTYTDASNYERCSLKWSSNRFYLYGENAGTGVPRALEVLAGTTLFLTSTSNPILLNSGTSIYQFSGQTSSFPALKRSTTTLQVRLADDSAYTNLEALNLGIGGAATATSFATIAAGTTAKSQINLASSTAPTSPVDGDVWFDGTNLKIRVSGATKTVTIT